MTPADGSASYRYLVAFQSPTKVKLSREGRNDSSWDLSGNRIQRTKLGMYFRLREGVRLLMTPSGQAVQGGSEWINMGTWTKEKK